MMRKAGKLLLVVALFPLALAAGAAVAAGLVWGLALYGFARTVLDIWRGP